MTKAYKNPQSKAQGCRHGRQEKVSKNKKDAAIARL